MSHPGSGKPVGKQAPKQEQSPWQVWRDERLRQFRMQLAGLDSIPQLLILGVLSGILTGSVILLFRAAIELPLALLLPSGDAEGFESLDEPWRMALPLLGACLITLVFLRLGVAQRKVGVAHVMERLGYHQGYLSLKSGLLQFFCGVTTIVSGQSAGREGPAVHLGATASSLLGQRLALPNNSIRMLVGCGTAAAISASFNTPIAGVIFAMEVVMLEYTITGFMPVILAAVTGALITQTVYGNEPAFLVSDFVLESFWELPYIIALGLLLGMLSAGFARLLTTVTLKVRLNLAWRMMAAGFLTGLAAFAVPQIMGVGYDTVNSAIAGDMAFLLLIGIGVTKLVVTAVAIGLGMPSGIIGPALFIGACVGGALGVLAQFLMPTLASHPGFYAVMGMGAMMSALLQAPLAAMTAVIELTQSPNIMLPVMLCIICSNAVSSHFYKQRSIFQTILQNQGLDYRAEPLTMALRRVSVGALMNRNFRRCESTVSLEKAKAVLKEQPEWLLVDLDGEPRMLMPPADLARYIEEQEEVPEQIDLIKIPARRQDAGPLPVQATLEEALDQLAQTGFEALYVQRTSAPLIKPVVGVVTRQAIEAYYQYKSRTHN